MDEKNIADLPLKSVHCLFRHDAFYANLQENDEISETMWDVIDKTLWKPMSREMIEKLPQLPLLPLYPSNINANEMATQLEARLQNLITTHRRSFYQVSSFVYSFSFIKCISELVIWTERY